MFKFTNTREARDVINTLLVNFDVNVSVERNSGFTKIQRNPNVGSRGYSSESIDYKLTSDKVITTFIGDIGGTAEETRYGEYNIGDVWFKVTPRNESSDLERCIPD